jgi:Protein of unknown function (DUF5818)
MIQSEILLRRPFRLGAAFFSNLLVAVVAFTIVALVGSAWAQGPGTGMVYEGSWSIPGKVEKTQEGYILKASNGHYRLTGADPAPWIGKYVKASGRVLEDEGTLVQTIHVDRFEPLTKKKM